MKIICINNITVIDPASPWHRQNVSILIKDGVVNGIFNTRQAIEDALVLDGAGKYISMGWIDLRANFCDPGFEYKEDLDSGSEAAAYGGFTGVALLPETDPMLATKSAIEYIRHKADKKIIDIYPLASITTDKDQQNLTEMFDVKEAGAAGFSSGYRPVAENGFLLRAMQYAGMTGMPMMVRPENKSISGKGMINEGITSVKLGLKGVPAIAEEIDINTMLSLCGYTTETLHFSGVSTAAGMQALENAYNSGLKISADVSIHHLYFTEEDIDAFETNLKLRPPLRTENDKRYLQQAALDNKFVSVVSDHNPQEEDKKQVEFEIASYGAIGLQTVFPQLLEIYGLEKLDEIVAMLTLRPRHVLNLHHRALDKDTVANFTIFDTDIKWVYNNGTNKSKSKNSPLWNRELIGRATAIINKGEIKILN